MTSERRRTRTDLQIAPALTHLFTRAASFRSVEAGRVAGRGPNTCSICKIRFTRELPRYTLREVVSRDRARPDGPADQPGSSDCRRGERSVTQAPPTPRRLFQFELASRQTAELIAVLNVMLLAIVDPRPKRN